ncbi:ROK family protein [Pendulispora brunnea]|uniref:ROK family protein n=1 Tax=Pendulispora brunnea TaxID=2905690 RepID=A0ABZ2KKN9_9BACT
MTADHHHAHALRRQGELAVLRYVHANPGSTRAQMAKALALGTGSATEITTRLRARKWIDEIDGPKTGTRGRPSPTLVPHPKGPLVCAVEIGHERWRMAIVELGAGIVEERSGRHGARDAESVLAALRKQIAGASRECLPRLRAISVAVSGTVQRGRIVQSTLGWSNVGIEALRIRPGMALLLGNDASLGGVAEARRGAGRGVAVLLHLTIEVGVGGVLVVDGRPVLGASGAAGEFGHMPFGDRTLRCPCGAHGCWDLEVDGRAMARHLGQPPPRDPRSAAERTLRDALGGASRARKAVASVTAAFGRGAGALVSALDPDRITLSGLARELATAAPDALECAYRDALMSFRREAPPPFALSALGTDGVLLGAAEVAFDEVLSDVRLAGELR